MEKRRAGVRRGRENGDSRRRQQQAAKESAEAGRMEARGGDSSKLRKSPQGQGERRSEAETAGEVRGSQRGSREAKPLNLKGIKETIIKVIQQCYNQREPNSGGNRRTG